MAKREDVQVDGRTFKPSELIRQVNVRSFAGATAVLAILALVTGIAGLRA